jgi:hypothetical protein
LLNDATATAALKNDSSRNMGNCLDTLRGYSQSAAAVEATHDNEYMPGPEDRGYEMLNEPSSNKGDSFLISLFPASCQPLVVSVLHGYDFFFISLVLLFHCPVAPRRNET